LKNPLFYYTSSTLNNRVWLISHIIHSSFTRANYEVYAENYIFILYTMKPSQPQFELLTFYHFVDIPEQELESVCAEHLQFCSDLGLKWRIYIGTEWISSTVSGNLGQCLAYRLFLQSSKYFSNIADIDTKATLVEGHQFPKLTVKIRDEIVVLWEKVTEDEVKHYKKELTPSEFKKIIDEGSDEYVILDMRNDYEYQLGHFKWAIPAGTVNFREVPKLIERYRSMSKGKKIVWYCTGGIRCEKAAVLANKAGLEDVYAIEGGVVKYVNTFNDGNWLGNLYTFDDRVSTFVGDEKTHTTIGSCLHSGKPTDHCDNCRYTECNARIIVDFEEHKKHCGFCSQECFEKALQTLLIKDVAWDCLKVQSTKYIEHRSLPLDMPLGISPVQNGGSFLTYKELRSLIKVWKISFPEAQKIVSEHLTKKLWKTSFVHKESQKEGVIQMD